MSRNVEMHDSSAMMLQQDKHEQEPKAQRGHHEEINGDELLGMIFQECPPRLGRRLAVSRHVFGNRGFRHLDPEFQQLSVNSERTPGWIPQAHFMNQGANLGGNLGPARTRFALPLPVKTKTFSMPGNHSLWFHDDQSRTPARPNPGELNPEQPIRPAELPDTAGVSAGHSVGAVGGAEQRFPTVSSPAVRGKNERRNIAIQTRFS